MGPSIDVYAVYGSDGAAIQKAIDAVASDLTLPPSLYLRSGVWPVAAELTIPAGCRPLTIGGDPSNYTGADGTILQATTSMRSVMAVLSPYHNFVNLKLDANFLATYGRFISNWTFGRQTWVVVMNAVIDGDHLDNTTGIINDCIHSTQCFWVQNGQTFATAGIAGQYLYSTVKTVTGTAATTLGSGVITFTGAPDLTTLNIRYGDFIRLGTDLASASVLQIDSVTASTITVMVAANNQPKATASGLDYAIGVGDGWHETQFRDNNRNVFDDCILRHSGGSGLMMAGLYGDSVYDGLIDYNAFFGVAMGYSDNVSLTDSIGLHNVYMEANTVDYFFGQVTNLLLANTDNNGSLYSVTGSTPTGVVIQQGNVSSLTFGTPQNFLLEVRNEGGTLQSRFVSDHWNGFAAAQVGKVNGASTAWTNIPAVGATTPFANGVGISSANPNVLLFDVANNQSASISGVVALELSCIGAIVPSLTIDLATNVNGVALVRPALCLTTLTGAQQAWSATTITPGQSLSIRVQASML